MQDGQRKKNMKIISAEHAEDAKNCVPMIMLEIEVEDGVILPATMYATPHEYCAGRDAHLTRQQQVLQYLAAWGWSQERFSDLSPLIGKRCDGVTKFKEAKEKRKEHWEVIFVQPSGVGVPEARLRELWGPAMGNAPAAGDTSFDPAQLSGAAPAGAGDALDL